MNRLREKGIKSFPEQKINDTKRCVLLAISILLLLTSGAKSPDVESVTVFRDSVDDKFESLVESNENSIVDQLERLYPGFSMLVERYQNVEDFVDGLAKVRRQGKFGVVTIRGLEIVPCVYDELYAFNNGLAVARRNGKYGIINDIGEEIIQCKYDKLYSFEDVKRYIYEKSDRRLLSWKDYNNDLFDREERIGVMRDGKIGYVDKHGKEDLTVFGKEYICVDDKFDTTQSENGGFIVSLRDKYGLLDDMGRQILPCEYDWIYDWRFYYKDMPTNGRWWAHKDGKKILLDKNGKIIEPSAYGYLYKFQDNGLARFEKDDKWGVTDRRGKVIVECKYMKIDEYSNGLARVYLEGRNIMHKHCGMVDESGREVIPCIYDDRFYFGEDGFAKVQKDGKYGFIDRKGNEVIPCVYDNVNRNPNDGFYRLVRNGYVEICDKFGNEIMQPSQYLVGDIIKGYAQVYHKRKQGLIDINGKMIVPLEYYNALQFTGGYIMVQDEQYITHVYDFNGRKYFSTKYNLSDGFTMFLKSAVTSEPAKLFVAYEWVGDFRRYGCLNLQGHTVVPFKYDGIHRFDKEINGYAKVEMNHRFGFINSDGVQVLPCEYDDISFLERTYIGGVEEHTPENGLGRICRNSKWGFMDHQFNVVVECKYEQADWFRNGLSRVKLNGKFGCINAEGEEVIPCRYDELSDFRNGFSHCMADGRYGMVNSKGEECWFKGS